MQTYRNIIVRSQISFIISLLILSTNWSYGGTNQVRTGTGSVTVSPVPWITATDGLYADKVVVSWGLPAGITTNSQNCLSILYRSLSTNTDTAYNINLLQGYVALGHPITNQVDNVLCPYVKYYYWVRLAVQDNVAPFNWVYSDFGPCAVGSAGLPKYTAVPADYDGDGLIDIASYQESTGDWKILLSSSGYSQYMNLPGFLGGWGFIPMPMDYDNDGKADPAVFNEETGEWRIRLSNSGYSQITINLN